MKQRTRLRFVLEGIEGLGMLVCVLVTWPVSKRWLKDWGSNLEERERQWPGDQYVGSNHQTYTRGISVRAPTDIVWQWIVQFGLGRGGFYSYELLERIAGIPVTNVESIEPTMQALARGDLIRLHPKVPGIPVAQLEKGRRICFGAANDLDSSDDRPDPARSWSVYLEPTGKDSCRLLLRACIAPLRDRSWPKRLGAALEAPIDFVMEQRMLRSVKRLAESRND